MPEIIGAQINNLPQKSHRQSEGSEKIEEDRLEQKDSELEKGPGMSAAILKHCPPRLHIDDEQQHRPSNRGAVDPDAVARINDLAESLEQLSHAQAENDRENNREIPKLIHARPSALSTGRVFVDHASTSRSSRLVLSIASSQVWQG